MVAKGGVRGDIACASVLNIVYLTDHLAATYYGFWNNGSRALFEATVSTDYVDQTLPAGRAHGPQGLADACSAFFESFPDGRVHVQQQMLVGDRIVSSGAPALRRRKMMTGTLPASGRAVRQPRENACRALSLCGTSASVASAAVARDSAPPRKTANSPPAANSIPYLCIFK